jgi:hypothetical protein
MNTIERKKIKGGKYEYFIADEDGNFIEDISSAKLFNMIKDCQTLIELIDGNDDKDRADKRKLEKIVENIFSLTTAVIEGFPENKL